MDETIFRQLHTGHRSVRAVIVIIAAQDFGVKSRPARALVDIIPPRVKRMARGPNAHERFAAVQVLADQIEILGRQRPPSYTDHQQIGVLHGIGETGKVVFVCRVLLDDDRLQAAPVNELFRKCRQRFPRVILILTNQEDDLRRLIGPETKGFATEKRRAGD